MTQRDTWSSRPYRGEHTQKSGRRCRFWHSWSLNTWLFRVKHPTQRIFVISTIVTLWVHMVVTTISGGAHPEIEPTVPIMALLNSEHMFVQGKNPYITYICDIDHSDPLGTHGRQDHRADHTQKSSRNGRLSHSWTLNTWQFMVKTPTQRLFLI